MEMGSISGTVNSIGVMGRCRVVFKSLELWALAPLSDLVFQIQQRCWVRGSAGQDAHLPT